MPLHGAPCRGLVNAFKSSIPGNDFDSDSGLFDATDGHAPAGL